MAAALALLLAWGADARFGEPRSAWHPVAWFGRAMAPLTQWMPTLSPAAAFVAGTAAWTLAVGGVALLAWIVQHELLSLAPWLAVPLLALALKPSFAWRMLKDEVLAVDTALARSLPEGRTQLARLCSRDVSRLDATAVRETAIETLAENFNDSLVAPLFWFAVAGLPGAWAWRAANTLDAMWGYRGRFEWAGKWAARADDVLGFVPARLAALLLWSPSMSFDAVRREARRTPSPNGGWPMGAMAMRLGVRLSKPGVYVLNPTGSPADAASLARALRIAERGARICFGVTVTAFLLAGWLR